MKTTSLALMFALVFGAILLAGCGGDTSSPENVVKAYHEALKAKDKERMKKLMCKEDMKGWKDDVEIKADDDQQGEYEVGSATVSGDKATVPVTYTQKDGKKTDPIKYHTIQEDGEWKMDMGTTFAEMLKEAFKGE